MMQTPLSLNHFLARAKQYHGDVEIVTRMPDKSLHRQTYADFNRRALALAEVLVKAGIRPGDRVATLCWNHYAHLECYFGIPAAGAVMHNLNLRLFPHDIAFIVNHAKDRVLIVDDVLLPLLAQFAKDVKFERVIVVPGALGPGGGLEGLPGGPSPRRPGGRGRAAAGAAARQDV